MIMEQLFRLVHGKTMQQFAGIPGPTPSFPMGNANDLSGKLVPNVLTDYAKQYGDVVLFWILGRPNVSITDPELIRQVMLRESSPVNSEKFYKDLPTKALHPMLTDTSTFEARDDGEKWQYLQRNHPFSLSYFRNWLESQVVPLQALLEERVEKLLEPNKTVPFYTTLQRLVFDGFSLAMVGKVFPGDAAFQEFLAMNDVGTKRMGKSTVLGNWSIKQEPNDPTYQNAAQPWFDRFSKLVEEAYAHPVGDCLLARVVRDGGTQFSKEQIRNICTEVYPGGSISVPSGIANALYLMSRPNNFTPTLEEGLRSLWSQPLTLDRLEACVPLEQVLRETLRLLPPVGFFLRNAKESLQLGQYKIPADATIYVSNGYLHRIPSYWGDRADQFDPSRWDDAKRAENDYGSDYFFPFGRGDRSCIGRFFALYFMRLALAVLLNKVQVDLGSQTFSQEFYFAVTIPDRKLKATFVRR